MILAASAVNFKMGWPDGYDGSPGVSEHLNDPLREERLRVGLTQVELADRLGWPQSTTSKSENGSRQLDVMELRALLGAMVLDLATFIAQLEARLAANTPLRHESGKAKRTR
nr:helix-turn-helix transcriptional regulator [uncultured Roseateles sp.]